MDTLRSRQRTRISTNTHTKLNATEPNGGRLGIDLKNPPEWWGQTVHGYNHELFRDCGGTGEDSGDVGLKDATIGWANGYYVTFALMMTIAFAALFIVPEARRQPEDINQFVEVIHWRVDSPAVDAIVQFLYVFFALLACYDSTWGTLLCAAWAVRAPCVPARVFERFLFRLTNQRTENPEHSGLKVKTLLLNRYRIYGEVNAWDPYYFVDRNVLSLFLCGACFLYLTQGLPHALLACWFLGLLRHRVLTTIAGTVDAALLGNYDKRSGKASEIYGNFGTDVSC